MGIIMLIHTGYYEDLKDTTLEVSEYFMGRGKGLKSKMNIIINVHKKSVYARRQAMRVHAFTHTHFVFL